MDCDLRLEMPVNMTMQDPRTGVVRNEADRNVVRGGSDVDNVAADRVDVVILAGAGDAHDVEGVPVEMHGVLLYTRLVERFVLDLLEALTGKPPGSESSMTLFPGRL